MMDGQHQRADIPVHARTAHKGLLQGLLWNSNRLALVQVYPSWESLCSDAFKPLLELFHLVVLVVLGWCIDLNDCGIV